MKVNYNVTGARRKSLVGAISQELNVPVKYLGMPTAAYEVGAYTIGKTGTVTGPDNLELVVGLRGLHDFRAVSEEYDTPAQGVPALPEVQEAPAYEDVNMTAEEEFGLGRNRRDPVGEDGPQASDAPAAVGPDRVESRRYRAELGDPEAPERMEVFTADGDEDALRRAYEYTAGEVVLLELHKLDGDYNEVRPVDIPRKSNGLVIEMPLKGFTPEKLDNLAKLIHAKAPLLKAALGVDDLPVEQTADTLRFPWFFEGQDLTGDEAAAYSMLVSLLCKAAKEKKRVMAKEKTVDGSVKYAMRCFLLSLGFIGDEYKTARRILLSKLEGSSSWKNGDQRNKPEVKADTQR